MIRSVVLWLPSGNVVLMRPTLAQVLLPGFANESLISNANWPIGAIAASQNARMPSCPRWPLPSGSNIDGPTGSSMTASSAYTVSHSSRSPLATAEYERCEAERAGCGSLGAFHVMASDEIMLVILEHVPVLRNVHLPPKLEHVSLWSMTEAGTLHAPMKVEFDYTRSLGPTLSEFMTGLKRRQILGGVLSDGTIAVPPPEFDAETYEPITEMVPVQDEGVV